MKHFFKHGIKPDARNLIGIAALLAAVVIIFLAYNASDHSKNSQIYDELTSEVKNSQSDSTELDASSFDFSKLEELNPDIYAWIEIPGTEVSYPIVQSSVNDNYYLDVTVDGKSGLPGSIYTQASYNKKDFLDFNTIVYGHDMKDGSMFGILREYREDAAFFESHKKIVVYTPEQQLTYRIFATIVVNDDLIPYQYDFNTQKGKHDFIDSIYDNTDSRSFVDTGVAVTTDSSLITLSTCISSESEHRFLVIGALE